MAGRKCASEKNRTSDRPNGGAANDGLGQLRRDNVRPATQSQRFVHTPNTVAIDWHRAKWKNKCAEELDMNRWARNCYAETTHWVIGRTCFCRLLLFEFNVFAIDHTNTCGKWQRERERETPTRSTFWKCDLFLSHLFWCVCGAPPPVAIPMSKQIYIICYLVA